MLRGVAAALLLTVAAGPAAAADDLAVRYVVAWAGVEVGDFTFEFRRADGRYRTAWRARTTGIAGRLFPFASAGSSSGRLIGGSFRSDRYEGSSRWRDRESAWSVAFAPDGRATRVTAAEPAGRGREPVPPALQMAPDPIALGLAALAAAGPGARFVGQSFDGRRVTSFAGTCAADPAGATGELACAVSGRLLAGAAREQRSKARDDRPREPLRVWLRQELAGEGWWPVRLELATRLGRISARLAGPAPPPHIDG